MDLSTMIINNQMYELQQLSPLGSFTQMYTVQTLNIKF